MPTNTHQIPASSIGVNIQGNAGGTLSFAIFGIIWIAITSFFYWNTSQDASKTPPPFWFFGLFYAFGLLIMSVVAYNMWSKIRYGGSVLDLQSSHVIPGGTLQGTIRIPKPFIYRGEMRLRLACIRGVARKSRVFDSGWIQENSVLWQQYCSVDQSSSMDKVSIIPVSFVIPENATPSSDLHAGAQILWRLDAKAKTGGIPYAVSFIVPVQAG